MHRIDGLGGRVRRNGRLIDIHAGSAGPVRLRPYLYILLNRYERDHFIAVRNMPVCAMPDAWDHFFQMRGRVSKDSRCAACRFHASCGGPSSGFSPSCFADVPREIAIEVTTACNLACGICFHAGAGSRHLPLSALLKVFKQMRRAGCHDVRFTGGEPLLYPHLQKAVIAAKKFGFQVSLNTNGLLFDEAKAEFFRRYADSVLVSMQGCDSSSESRLTGIKGDFRDKLRRIRFIAGRCRNVRIGTVVSRHLVRHLEDYLSIER